MISRIDRRRGRPSSPDPLVADDRTRIEAAPLLAKTRGIDVQAEEAAQSWEFTFALDLPPLLARGRWKERGRRRSSWVVECSEIPGDFSSVKSTRPYRHLMRGAPAPSEESPPRHNGIGDTIDGCHLDTDGHSTF